MKAKNVAKYLLSLVDTERGQVISNLALQKLLYYCQGYYLAFTKGKEALFEENILKWKYGPVVREVYDMYKEYGDGALPTDEFTKEIENEFTKDQKEIMENVFEFFKGYSAIALMEKTHNESPWRTTEIGDVISIEKIYKLFKGKVTE